MMNKGASNVIGRDRIGEGEEGTRRGNSGGAAGVTRCRINLDVTSRRDTDGTGRTRRGRLRVTRVTVTRESGRAARARV